MNLECIPCIQRQVIEACRMASFDESKQADILLKAIDRIRAMKWELPPPSLAQAVHSIVRAELGVDPYRKVKHEHNMHALSLYHYMKDAIETSDEPVKTAFKVAIAGNVMDFGPSERADFEHALKGCLESDLFIDESDALKDRLSKSTTVLYLLDNAGEVVCDRVAIETILDTYDTIESLVVACKGGPILNDATYEDVRFSGLSDIDKVSVVAVNNGDPNTGLKRDSYAFRSFMGSYDVTISKGQGNYELLSECKDVFFLLKAKCPLIAQDAQVDIGSMICGRKK